MALPDPADVGPSAPEQSEINSIQAAAKWLVGAFATVFAALMTGVQLSALSGLGAERPGQLALAIIASGLALAASAVILVQAVRVLAHPGLTLGKLAHLAGRDQWNKHWLNDQLGGSQGAFGIQSSKYNLRSGEELGLDVVRLYRHFVAMRGALNTYRVKHVVEVAEDLDAPDSTTLIYTQNNVADLRDRVNAYEDVAQRVADTANLLVTRRRYVHLMKLMWLGAIPVIAIPVFVAATAQTVETPVSAPMVVRVKIGEGPNVLSRLADLHLPDRCAGQELLATAIGGTLSQPVVISDASQDCPLDRIEIGPELGIAFPVHPR
jgi:hypothetical protein